MKEPPKDSTAAVVCTIAAVLCLVVALLMATSAPADYRDPMGRALALYVASAVAGAAIIPALFAMLFFHLHRMTLINYAILSELQNTGHVQRSQMRPVERLASALAAKHGLN